MPLSYDEPLFRPPSEADALIIQATQCSPAFTSALTLMLPTGPGRLQRDFPEWKELSPLETLGELKVFVRSYDGASTIFRRTG